MSASQAGSTPRLGFALLAALLVLALIEGSARVFMAGLEATGFDEASWRNAWVRDRAGRREIFYSFDRFDPSKGWISKSNLRDHPAFAGIALSTIQTIFRIKEGTLGIMDCLEISQAVFI